MKGSLLMKYMIASDIHGSAESCSRLLGYYEEYGCERLVLLGDLLYHGPRNDLPSGYDVRTVADMLNKYAAVIYAVRGNCDADVDKKMFDFPIEARYMVLTEGGKAYFATHGDRYNCGHLPPIMGVDVLLTGHTHVPACENHIDYIYCNPGSVSIPKGGSCKSFMIIEGNHLEWRALDDGRIYMSTDI